MDRDRQVQNVFFYDREGHRLIHLICLEHIRIFRDEIHVTPNLAYDLSRDKHLKYKRLQHIVLDALKRAEITQRHILRIVKYIKQLRLLLENLKQTPPSSA